jgi:hypothetical protein
VALMTPLNSGIRPASGQLTANFFFALKSPRKAKKVGRHGGVEREATKDFSWDLYGGYPDINTERAELATAMTKLVPN